MTKLLVCTVAVGEMIRPNDELPLHVELIDGNDGTRLWSAQFKEFYADDLVRPEELPREFLLHCSRFWLAP